MSPQFLSLKMSLRPRLRYRIRALRSLTPTADRKVRRPLSDAGSGPGEAGVFGAGGDDPPAQWRGAMKSGRSLPVHLLLLLYILISGTYQIVGAVSLVIAFFDLRHQVPQPFE